MERCHLGFCSTRIWIRRVLNPVAEECLKFPNSWFDSGSTWGCFTLDSASDGTRVWIAMGHNSVGGRHMVLHVS